jgi:RNA polymerase sigma factor (sigma-70 family)
LIIEDKISDQELLLQYKEEKRQDILAQLYMRYKGLVFGVCNKYLQDTEASHDAVMDIYQELITKCLQYDISNFKSWLHTLSKNHSLLKLRKEKKVVPFDAEIMQNEDLPHLPIEMEKEATFTKMEDCLNKLETAQKQSVTLFYLQNKCYKEISELTGLEWNKVRSYIQNGRRNLKICMEK